jgi:hypothetical protein
MSSVSHDTLIYRRRSALEISRLDENYFTEMFGVKNECVSHKRKVFHYRDNGDRLMRRCHVEVMALIHCQTPATECDICSQNTIFWLSIRNICVLNRSHHARSAPSIIQSVYNADHW